MAAESEKARSSEPRDRRPSREEKEQSSDLFGDDESVGGLTEGWAGSGTRGIRIAVGQALCLGALVLGVGPSVDASEPDPRWLEGAYQSIAQQEYWATSVRQEGSLVLQAPNRAQGFRTRFEDGGVRVVPRTSNEAGWSFSLGLVGVGRGDVQAPVAPAEVSASENRVLYDRPVIDEWYVNDPAGLEQGFTIGRRILSEEEESLALVLSLGGSLRMVLSSDGQAVDLLDDRSPLPILRYAKLVVTDAAGTRLASHLEPWSGPDGRGLRIVVDDRSAAYPITVDPLISASGWTLDSDQSGASLGTSVATAGDVNGDGYSDLAIGAPNYDAGSTDEGRVFVFMGSPSGPAATADWVAECNQPWCRMGSAVAPAGDVDGDGYGDLLVGCPDYDNGSTNEGIALLYRGSPSGLDLLGTRTSGTPSNADWGYDPDQSYAYLGRSLASAGDVNNDGYADVVVGAYSYSNGESDEGGVFVFHGSASGLSATPNFVAESDDPNAWFGDAVASAGDIDGDGYSDLVVGCPRCDGSGYQKGVVFVYRGSFGGLTSPAVRTYEGAKDSGDYGKSVATAGDVNGDGYADLLVGAPRADAPLVESGLMHVFYGSASGLSATPDWIVQGDQADGGLGRSVSTAGDVTGDGYADVIVGAYLQDEGQSDEGAVFLYMGSPSGLDAEGTRPTGAPANADWSAEGDQIDAWFGKSVAIAGDVNGDGYSDVVVGADGYDLVGTGGGRAVLYLGTQGGVLTASTWSRASAQAGSEMGATVSGAGDVNADGYADVMVGSPGYDGGLSGQGRVDIHFGGPSGISATPSWSALGENADARFGEALDAAGDVDGDGYGDVVIAAPDDDDGSGDRGKVYLYAGSSGGPDATPTWSQRGFDGSFNRGKSVAGVGDLDGDGYGDVVILDTAYVHFFRGSAVGLTTLHGSMFRCCNWKDVDGAGDVNGDGFADVLVAGSSDAMVIYGPFEGGGLFKPIPDAFFPYVSAESAAGVGDINGDGYADFVIGSSDYDDVYVYHGSPSGPSRVRTLSGFAAPPIVGGAGDVNGDGFADIIVGDPWQGPLSQGRASVYLGSASGIAGSPAWTMDGSTSGEELGAAVAGAGDVDGDGRSDVLIGSPSFNSDEGRFHLQRARDDDHPARVRQQKSDASTYIVPGLASDLEDSFRLRYSAWSVFGRADVFLEWEVRSWQDGFVGTATGASGTRDTWWFGTNFSEAVSGLAGATPYHWRVRQAYRANRTPYQPHGPWTTLPVGGWEEAKLRTYAESDLRVTQTDDVDPRLEGQDVTYTVTVTNDGPDPTTVTLVDHFENPSSSEFLSFESVVPSQGACTEVDDPYETGSNLLARCDLGVLAVGASATVVIQVRDVPRGKLRSYATARGLAVDPDESDNLSVEETTLVVPAIGDRVWEDSNGNGIQDSGEPGLPNVKVELYSGSGAWLASRLTGASGQYSFGGLTEGSQYFIRVEPPPDMAFSPADVGGDDTVDSDVDPGSWVSPAFSLDDYVDRSRWDVGLVPSPGCEAPDETIYLYVMTIDINGYPVLHFMDPNQPTQTTGYNVYRSSDPAPPPSTWPLLASNVVDMDQSQPNLQYVDSTGDVSPTGTWYYHVTAYNATCSSEGPF